MAIYKRGSDPDALDRSAELLGQYARECTGMRHAVSGVLGSLRSNWGGDNLQVLIREWPAIEQQLDGFGTQLQSLASRLTQNAAAQRGASGPAVPVGLLAAGGGIGGPAAPTADAVGADLWESFLEQSNVLPDGSSGPLAWPGLVGSNLLIGVGAMSSYMQKVGIGRWAPRGGPNNQFIARPTGRWASAWSMNRGGNWTANPYQAGNWARWGTVGEWAGRAGTVLSFGTSAFGQWSEDASDPNLGTTERVARATTAGATTAAGSWAGAWAGAQGGALIGAAVGGPVGAVVGGVIGGVIGGGLGGVVGSFVGDQIVGPVGDFAEWAGEGIGDAAESVGSFMGDVGDALSFWD